MGKAYSTDLRERVVRAYESGETSYLGLAELFTVGAATVNRWLRLMRETGDVKRRPHGGGKPRRIAGKPLETLQQALRSKNDATRRELAQVLQQKAGLSVSVATVGRTLQRLGLTRKKRQSTTRKGIPTAS